MITLSNLAKYPSDSTTNMFFRHELATDLKISITNPQITLPPLAQINSWMGSKVMAIANPDRDDLKVYIQN